MNLKQINEAIEIIGRRPAIDKDVTNLCYAATQLRKRLKASRDINITLRRRIRELEARHADNV